MSQNSFIQRLTQIERINFLLTNRIPRRYITLFMGWYSKLENRLISRFSIAIWKRFSSELDFSEAEKTEFDSLHDCFIRQLKPGARTIDQNPGVIVSPCDAIVGTHGQVKDTTLYQAKGFPYTLGDLLSNPELVKRYKNGHYVTLRLKSSMYHRFHAPYDCHVTKVNYISGDTWNVNPVALKRIERLYCKNERAVIDLNLAQPGYHMTLVPVAAILVAGIKLHCLPEVLDLRYKGPHQLACNTDYKKGDELGYFQHGSTIIVFASNNFKIADQLKTDSIIRMGQPLLHFD